MKRSRFLFYLHNKSIIALEPNPPSHLTSTAKMACLHFAPRVGHTKGNLNRADMALSNADPMAFILWQVFPWVDDHTRRFLLGIC